MIIQWNTISTFSFNGISITLETLIGILRNYNKKYIINLIMFKYKIFLEFYHLLNFVNYYGLFVF